MRIHFILQHNMLFRYSLGHLGLYLLSLLCIACNFLQVDIHLKVLNWFLACCTRLSSQQMLIAEFNVFMLLS